MDLTTDTATATATPPPFLRGDPDCTYKFVEARVSSSVDPGAAVDVACFMTTDTVDADDEVVLPSGADLSRFEKNPVLMLCHAYGQPGSYYPLPIGKVVWTRKRPHGVMAGIAFARSTTMGREVKALFDEDMCRSFSIGFRSLESSPMTWDEARSRADWKDAYQRRSGRILVHRRWSLLELSVAPIPSNEDALRAKYAARNQSIPSWINLTTVREANMTESDRDAPETTARRPERPPSKTDDKPIAEGDAVEWTRAGGGCGLVEKVHVEGSHPEDPEGEDAPEILASVEDPVAQIRCYRKKAGGYSETDARRAVHCRHLTRLAGGLPAPGPEQAKCRTDLDPSQDDDQGHALKPLDFVKIEAPHHKGFGQVRSLHRDGVVPDVEDDLLGTHANPAARVRCYKPVGDGFVATALHVGHATRHLEKIAPLRPPGKPRNSSRETPEPLPPLVGLSEQQVLDDALAKLNQLLKPDSIRKMVVEELEIRLGTV